MTIALRVLTWAGTYHGSLLQQRERQAICIPARASNQPLRREKAKQDRT